MCSTKPSVWGAGDQLRASCMLGKQAPELHPGPSKSCMQAMRTVSGPVATLKTLLTCCLQIVHSALRIAAFQLCIFVLRGNKADLLSRLNIEIFKKEKK